jgi:predicted  nucleic acid-binding Zn-ribbon protein
MVRCTKCRFLFESATAGLLPSCRQCGGTTTPVLKIEPAELTPPPSQPTLKLSVVAKP